MTYRHFDTMTTKPSTRIGIQEILLRPTVVFGVLTTVCAIVLLIHVINIHSNAIKTRVSIKLHNGTNWVAATLPKGIYSFYFSTNGNALQTISDNAIARDKSILDVSVSRNGQILYSGFNKPRGKFSVENDEFFDIIITMEIESKSEAIIYFNCGRPE